MPQKKPTQTIQKRRDTILKEKRRESVLRLHQAGYTQQKIANQLSVDIRTIKRDMYFLREYHAKEYVNVKGMERAAEYAEEQRSRKRMLHTIAIDSKNKQQDRIRALEALGREEDRGIKRDQIVGLLPNPQLEGGFQINTGGGQVQVQQQSVFQLIQANRQEHLAQAKVIDVNAKTKKK